MTRQTRANLVALATSINERTINRRLDEIDEGGGLVLDPDDTTVIELREHCRREVEQIASDRLKRRRAK